MTEFLWKMLDLTVLASLAAFVPSAIYFYWQRKKKVDSSINLILQYAEKAKKNVEIRGATYQSMLDQVEKGNPYDEPGKDYTPLLFLTKDDGLSFEQISEILRYLSSKAQKRLLEYFNIQSTVDAIEYTINTDYFRSIPQKRKGVIIKILQERSERLKESAEKLIEALPK